MSARQTLCIVPLLFAALSGAAMAELSQQPRLLILTDIGGDPDDQQSLIRLLLYGNEFDIEGLIATAAGIPGELKQDIVRPELIEEIVAAYGKVRDNLALHAPGYPAAKHLRDRIKSGNPQRGVAQLGAEHDTEGSRWIVRAADADDPRPLQIAIWGGSTELAQALWRVKHDRGQAGLQRFIAKLRVFAINHQDDTGPWIVSKHPGLFYILSRQPEGKDKRESAYRGMYLGGDESLTSRAWLDAHVRREHGPLGALYPMATWTAPNPHVALKEGDTPAWFYFLPTGLNDPDHPEWGSWGGRFQKSEGQLYRDAADTVERETHARATVWRWRPAFQADFQARMDWCVRVPREANHPPRAHLNGDATRKIITLAAKAGDSVLLDASGSVDPDGDRLNYRRWVYSEAGSYRGAVNIEETSAPRAVVKIPADAAGLAIHVILEVTDAGRPPLTSYRRAVISVRRG